MSDALDDLATTLRNLVSGTSPRVIPSVAPGAGPGAARREPEQEGKEPPRGAGRALGGYGGHGDPAVAIQPEEQTRAELHALLRATAPTRARDKQSSRARFSELYSPEGHIRDGWRFVAGTQSVFTGTMTPTAGTVVDSVAVGFPPAAISPVFLLNRYPGAMYMSIFINSFSWMPSAATATGVHRITFRDTGGATCLLGQFLASSQSASLQGINRLCQSPLTDPGTESIGTILVSEQAVATPVSVFWALDVTFVAAIPDPWFQAQQVTRPTPAEEQAALRQMGA